MRNREFFWPSLLYLTLGGLTSWFIALRWFKGGLLVLGAFLLGFVIFWAFTQWRYREIRMLSAYLARIYALRQPLDVRDNRQGDLSILKNDIYKLSTALYAQAQQLGRDKLYLADALSNISHQIKTPLTSLMVTTDLLADPDLSEEKRREFIATQQEQLDRIRQMIQSLLRFSRIDAGVVTYQKETLHLKTVLQRAVSPMQILMERKGVTLHIDCPDDLTWEGDFFWTVEALGNLVKNSAEHTPAGGAVFITCRQTPLYISIAVRDTGEGIAKEDLPYLFQRFYKGKHAGADSVGIGLAMAQSVFNSQNGKITAENCPEGGALFTVYLYHQIV